MVKLIDMMGRTVLQSEMTQSNLQMDISALSNGQYLLVMHEEGNLTRYERLMVNR
jgi:hypothetical protein